MKKLVLFINPFISIGSNCKHAIQLFVLFLFLSCISVNAVAQSGTVTFTGTSNVNMGLVLHDGTNSNDISGIQLDIFGAMTPATATARTSVGSFVFLSTDVIGTDYGIFGPIDATNGGYIEEPNNLPRLVVIMSHDGSAFNFKSIYVGDYIDSNTPIKFEGFRNGVSTGAVSLVLGAANNYQKTFDSSNGLTASIFQNVDEVRITNQIEGDMTHGIYAGFNNITIAPAVQPTTAPTVTTQAVSSITATTATGNGTITATGGANSTERGIYYSTTNGFANGTGTKVSTTGNWSTTGAFTQNITGLTAGTTYYAKAFATNSAGTSYGAQVSFTTAAAGVLLSSSPTISFSNATGFTANVATDGQGGSTNISDINIQIYPINSAATKLTTDPLQYHDGTQSGWTGYPAILTYGDINPHYGWVIKSDNGSEFKLMAIDFLDWGEFSGNTFVAEAFRNGTSLGKVTFNGNTTGSYVQLRSTGVLTSIFENVDEVRLYQQSGVLSYITLNNIKLTTPVVAAPAPVVSSAAVPANGTYTTGQNLDFTVNYNEAITVDTSGGTPYIPITLNTGGTVNASYVSGSGTTALTFRYTVASGNLDADGIAVGSAITANGGTLKNAGATNAILTLNNVGATTGILVDAIAPTVSSVSSTTANGTYKLNDVIAVTITLSEAVTVTGTPYLSLNSGGTASYSSGSGTSTLTFNYTIASGQSSTDLDYSTINSLNLSGGTIKDAAGNNLNLTLPIPGAAGSLGANKDIVIVMIPTITTQAVSSITATTATGNGTITATGGANSTERGIYYSTTNGFANGTGTKVSTTGNWSTTGAFTQNITGLTAGTTYYAKAFATNSAGTSYGAQVSFTTTVACLTTPVEGLTTFNSVPSSYTEYARSTNASSGISALSVACSGWDVTGYTTAGSDPYIIASENWTPASDGGFIYLGLETGTQTISSLRFKSNDGKLFDLNAMDLGYDAYSNIKFIITGYKNGTAVSGATYNVAAFNHFGSGGNWKTGIDIASNTNFIGIDEFRITADVANHVWAIDVDNINATNFRTPPPTTVPNAPTIGTVIAGNGQASVTFTPPASNGGSAITGYTVTSNPGGLTATGTSSPIIVTGLANGMAYTFTVTATNAIGTSSASAASSSVTPATVPNAPTIGTVIAGNGQASVAFTAPISNGGSAITGYTVTSNPGGLTATGTSSPIIVTGLANGMAYTFTVTATNAIGTSSASAASSSVTPATVPNAPTIGTVTAGNGQASVTFIAPASNGGSAITGYTVTSNPGGLTGTGTSSPIIVTGLANGTAYTFTVTATNAIGTSSASAASSSVTPATVPNAPTIGTVTAGNGQASVAFIAPASNGGSAITGYTVTSNPGGLTATGTSSPIIVTGLANGTAYTFTVTATNAIGTSSASDSGSTTPVLSTALNTMETVGVLVYPNPVTDGFYVTVGENFSSNKTYTCILTDMMGKTVMQETIKSGAYIAAENLPTGVYVLLVQDSDKLVKIKIVKK